MKHKNYKVSTYILHVFNDDEEFIKIGSAERVPFVGNVYRGSCYKYRRLYKSENISNKNSLIIERVLQELFYGYHHNPSEKFCGYTECFDMSVMQNAIETLRRIDQNVLCVRD